MADELLERSSNDVLNRLFSLRGRTALVTGGTSGIGLMIATAFVAAGARVYVVSRKAAACETTARELSQLGECLPLAGDVGRQEGCIAIAEAFRHREKSLDILVNGAGATWGAPLAEYPDAAWDKLLGINVKGLFQLTVALLPELEAAASAERPARVINIGSVHGDVLPDYETYAYSSSKAAAHHLTRHLAKRLGPSHITVNAIAPGPFPSRMMDAMIADHGDELVAQTATGRLGEPDDMAGVAIYLASRAGANVTGTVISVDGGYGTVR